jgi:ATP-binding cassette subfamily B protein
MLQKILDSALWEFQIDFKTLVEEVPFPCIVHWNKNHFVVVYKIDKNNKVYISDPSYGLITYTPEEFIKFWIGENANENTEEGIALILETTPAFFQTEFDDEESKASFSFFPNIFLNTNHLLFSLP